MSDDSGALWIEGKPYTRDDLTYRELRTLREYVRDLAGGDEDDAGEVDVVPAMVAVVMQRSRPGFSLEDALDVKRGDLGRPTEEAPKKRPPTRRAKK